MPEFSRVLLLQLGLVLISQFSLPAQEDKSEEHKGPELCVTWEQPPHLIFPEPLDARHLNAVANFPCTFEYCPSEGTVLPPGYHCLTVNYVPNNPQLAAGTASTVVLVLDAATLAMPVITWNNPPNILSGTALGAFQLNATADVPGTFVYNPPSGTVLAVGNNRPLSTTFTPTDTANYSTASKTVFINVLPRPINVPTVNYAVQLSATVLNTEPSITLNWISDANATAYTVYRKNLEDTTWPASGVSLPANALSYKDTSVTVGGAYEYRVVKDAIETASGYPYNGWGYIFAGLERPLIESRGTIILLVDNTFITSLAPQLAVLQDDLTGDGWTVVRHDVSRTDSVANIKAIIAADYNNDPQNVKSVFLFGHIPVPYSGNINPDEHPDHLGAWPADVYYANLTGAWTDTVVNNATAARSQNRNVPGDGKFDQSNLPSDAELQLGRVDLSNMPAFSLSETALLAQYLNKDHNFRHRAFSIQRRGLIDENFPTATDAFAAPAWRDFSIFFQPANIVTSTWIPTLATQGYLWSYGCGPGAYSSADGVATTSNFATTNTQTVFTALFGSYFGDWDNQNNLLRAPLCTSSYTLTCAWSGRPWWNFHHMALGETIGFSTRVSQNNSGSLYTGHLNGFRDKDERGVFMALMGDPTLRMHPVAPVTNLTFMSGVNGVALNWTAAADTVVGYNVYRATSHAGPYTRLNAALISGTSYADLNLSTGTYFYMVRAVKLESSASGTYFNASQGIFLTVPFGVPTVSLTSPANNATFIPPATITLTATASDDNGTISRVDFYSGTMLIGSATENPYSYVWQNVPAGNYVLTAVATDNENFATTSSPVNISVSTTNIPTPWLEQDIGAVGVAGSATFSGGVFTALGSGKDIWDNADAFHFVYQPLNGDGQITARVFSIQNTNAWAKSGVMIRNTLTANSAHAFMALSSSSGTAFQRRATAGGTTVNNSGSASIRAPYWVRVVRSGNTFTGYQSTDGVTWQGIAAQTITMNTQVYMGLVVCSHANTVLNTTVFSNVSTVGSGNAPPTVSLTSPASGTQFRAPANITINANASDTNGSVVRVDFYAGTMLLSSSTTSPYSYNWPNVAAGNYTLTAVATDNGGATTTSTPVTISANVNQAPLVSISAPSGGTQFRAGTNITINATASDNDGSVSKVDFYASGTLIGTSNTSPYSFQWTNVAVGNYSLTAVATDNENLTGTSTPVSISVVANLAPSVALTAPANNATFAPAANITLTATAGDNDGSIGQVDFYSGTTLLGSATASPYSFIWMNVAVGNYVLTAVATDNENLSTTSLPVNISVNASGLPSPWLEADIGTTGAVGSATFSAGTFTVRGAGADIWDTTDSFHFVYQSLNGNGTITARVASIQNTNGWAKSGVMIRNTLTANSAHAFMALSATNGPAFQRRATTGGITTNNSGNASIRAPYWVRVVRSGNTLTGYQSANGVTWTGVGSQTITMNTQVYIGLVVCSHASGVLNTTTFTDVTVQSP